MALRINIPVRCCEIRTDHMQRWETPTGEVFWIRACDAPREAQVGLYGFAHYHNFGFSCWHIVTLQPKEVPDGQGS